MKKGVEKEEVIVKMATKPPEESIKDIRNGYEKKKYVKEDSS